MRQSAQAQSVPMPCWNVHENTESQGRLVIDLDKLLNADVDNFELPVKAGDQLYVPQIPYSVSVSVKYSSRLLIYMTRSLDMDDYLSRSGGFTQNADKDRTFVVKSNGAVMTKGGNAWF